MIRFIVVFVMLRNEASGASFRVGILPYGQDDMRQ
jgi:hypothetical protein